MSTDTRGTSAAQRAKWTVGHVRGDRVFSPCTIFDETDESIAAVYGIPSNTCLDEIADDPRYQPGLRNARLIAEAPRLFHELEHLVRLLEPLERDGGLNVPGLATLNGARAAIAKARGEA